MTRIYLSMILIYVTQGAFSQCNTFYHFNMGKKWEMESYSENGKKEGKIVQEITAFNESGSSYEATIHQEIYDKKDKLTVDHEFEVTCRDGVMYFDMNKFLPQNAMQGMGDMEFKLEGDNLELPSDLSVGQALPDASMRMSAQGAMPFNMSFTMFDRKVEAKESITTPAGTFDCYKMTYKTKMKTVMGIETSGAEWISEGIGVVKTESFNKNGKSMGYSLLTKIY